MTGNPITIDPGPPWAAAAPAMAHAREGCAFDEDMCRITDSAKEE
ncbi:MAG: hypothetical protein ACP59X_15325 [Solidesulfovibrio sp. DCME]